MIRGFSFSPLYEKGNNMNRKTSLDIKKTASIAMLSALAFLARLVFKIPVSFLTFDIKDTVIALGGLVFGPVSGVVIALVVSLVEMIISETGPIGFIMNFVSSAVFAGVASLIYKFKRTFNGAIIGLYSSVAATTAVMLLMNVILTPIYQGVPRSAVIAMLPTLFLPFNFAKTLLNAAIVMLIYKPVVVALRKAKILEGKTMDVKFGKQSVITIIISSVSLVAAIVIFVILNNK
jgi:riboflavin transporter FmnP